MIELLSTLGAVSMIFVAWAVSVYVITMALLHAIEAIRRWRMQHAA
jgi:hypothetical protein